MTKLVFVTGSASGIGPETRLGCWWPRVIASACRMPSPALAGVSVGSVSRNLDPASPFDRLWNGVSMVMTEHVPDSDRIRPIEEWSDEELVSEFRYVKAELADEDPEYRDSDGAPAHVIEEEIRRRGLEPDREDVIPDAVSPGREDEGPRVRG